MADTDYRDAMQKSLSDLNAVFARAAVGDFSSEVDVPESEYDEIVTLYTGVNIMLDVINRQLIDLRRHAEEEEELNRLKSEFVAMVSHQLRTPLALMRWSVERLLTNDLSALSDKAREDIETIRREIGRMATLVSDILDVSRLEAGTLVINPRETDIVEAARSTVAEVAAAAHERGVKIIENYGEERILIPADRTLMHVIYMNLLTNAVKYTSLGGTVTLTIARDPKGIVISVADTGFGIPESERAKVFGKLFRGKEAQKIDSTGTGLGLYIVRAVVEAAGGTIRFVSEEGKGTTFIVTLLPGGMMAHVGNIHLHTPPTLDVPMQ